MRQRTDEKSERRTFYVHGNANDDRSAGGCGPTSSGEISARLCPHRSVPGSNASTGAGGRAVSVQRQDTSRRNPTAFGDVFLPWSCEFVSPVISQVMHLRSEGEIWA